VDNGKMELNVGFEWIFRRKWEADVGFGWVEGGFWWV